MLIEIFHKKQCSVTYVLGEEKRDDVRDPKLIAGDPAAVKELIKYSASVDPYAAPDGLLCFTMIVAGLSIRYFMILSELSMSVRFVFPGCLPN